MRSSLPAVKTRPRVAVRSALPAAPPAARRRSKTDALAAGVGPALHLALDLEVDRPAGLGSVLLEVGGEPVVVGGGGEDLVDGGGEVGVGGLGAGGAQEVEDDALAAGVRPALHLALDLEVDRPAGLGSVLLEVGGEPVVVGGGGEDLVDGGGEVGVGGLGAGGAQEVEDDALASGVRPALHLALDLEVDRPARLGAVQHEVPRQPQVVAGEIRLDHRQDVGVRLVEGPEPVEEGSLALRLEHVAQLVRERTSCKDPADGVVAAEAADGAAGQRRRHPEPRAHAEDRDHAGRRVAQGRPGGGRRRRGRVLVRDGPCRRGRSVLCHSGDARPGQGTRQGESRSRKGAYAAARTRISACEAPAPRPISRRSPSGGGRSRPARGCSARGPARRCGWRTCAPLQAGRARTCPPERPRPRRRAGT